MQKRLVNSEARWRLVISEDGKRLYWRKVYIFTSTCRWIYLQARGCVGCYKSPSGVTEGPEFDFRVYGYCKFMNGCYRETPITIRWLILASRLKIHSALLSTFPYGVMPWWLVTAPAIAFRPITKAVSNTYWPHYAFSCEIEQLPLDGDL